MRIGIEAQRIFRAKKHGMDIFALELIKQLQQIDHINEYFIFVMPGPDKCLEETKNFKIKEVRGFTYADWEQISLPLAIAEFNLEVLHCTSNTAPLFAGVPVTLTLHDIIYLNQEFSGGSIYQKLGHYYRKWIVPKVFKNATRVLTVSDFEKAHINNYFGDSDKVEVVYNGVSPKFCLPESGLLNKVKSSLNLPEKYLFFLGNTAPKKNMSGVLKAYSIYRQKSINPIPLVIAESSQEDVKSLLYAMERTELMHHIHLTGYVNHDWLPALYAMADLFLYPSLRESFGIPIIEAMACGTPVITSNTSAMPEVAGGQAMLCDPYDEESIADCILSITNSNPTEKNHMVSKGLAHAKKFTWEKTARQILNAYRGTNVQYLALP